MIKCAGFNWGNSIRNISTFLPNYRFLYKISQNLKKKKKKKKVQDLTGVIQSEILLHYSYVHLGTIASSVKVTGLSRRLTGFNVSFC